MFWEKSKEVSVTVSTERCVGCGRCVERCRREAMGLIQLRTEHYAMLVNPGKCNGCGKCAKVCNFNAIEIVTHTDAFEDPAWEF